MNLYDKLEGKKTFLYAVVGLVLGYIPGVREWLSAHPSEAVLINSFIVMLLRFLTKSPVI